MMTLTRLTHSEFLSRIDALAALLQNVVDDGASIGFMTPLGLDEARGYWQGVADAMAGGTKMAWVATESDETGDDETAGCVLLDLEPRPNGNHRAEVQKLMVHTAHRRKGLGRKLMDELLQVAAEENRTLLVLDTRKGDPSEALYLRMGFVEAGVIPRFARSSDGQLADSVFYYRER